MISLCRVLTVFAVLCLSVLTLRSAPGQESVKLAVDKPLDSATTAELFEAPVRLMLNDLPINTDKKVTNISPTLYDVDGDGKPELIIGGVSGELGIHRSENVSQGTGSPLKSDPVWGACREFEDSAGDVITLTNW